MLTIRFERVGRKNRAQFRMVLQENKVAPGGRHLAVLGSYDPHQKTAVLKTEKIQEWLGKGAQASTSVHNLLVREGVIVGEKKKVKMPKPEIKEVSAEGETQPVEEVKAEVKTEEASAGGETQPVEEKKEETKAE